MKGQIVKADHSQEKHSVFLTGADEYQWALREDYNQTIVAAKAVAEFTSLENSGIIHAVYWEALKSISANKLDSCPVICNLSGEWSRYEQDAGQIFLNIAAMVDIWVVRSRQAQKTLQQKGYNVFFIPYTVNTDVFRPLENADKQRIRKKLKIPQDSYVIGNFMRDSTAGRMCAPKLVKGPDIFVDIVQRLRKKEVPVHVLLAGPRRHWIRKRLGEEGVPFTFFGWNLWFDDMRINTLNRARLNELYNVLDLSLVSSRSEAGPHAILEAAAAKCSQLSSRVGIAEDVLSSSQIYDDVDMAVAKIEDDILAGSLKECCCDNYETVLSRHTADSCAKSYQDVYNMAITMRKEK